MLPLCQVNFFRGFALWLAMTVSSSLHMVSPVGVSRFPHGAAQVTNGLRITLITSSYFAKSFISEQSCILRHEELGLEHASYRWACLCYGEPIHVTILSQAYKKPPSQNPNSTPLERPTHIVPERIRQWIYLALKAAQNLHCMLLICLMGLF